MPLRRRMAVGDRAGGRRRRGARRAAPRTRVGARRAARAGRRPAARAGAARAGGRGTAAAGDRAAARARSAAAAAAVAPFGGIPAPPAQRGGSRGVHPVRAGRRRPARAARQRSRAAGRRRARGPSRRARRGEFLSDVDVAGDHVRVLTAPLERRRRDPARPLAGVDRLRARAAALGAAGAGGRRASRSPLLLGRLAARHLVAPVVRVTEAARHIAQTEDLGPPDRGHEPGRGGRARRPLQRDARHAGGLDRRAAAAGRGRVARAAHARDLAAHEHRGARARATRSRPSARA